MDKLQVFEGELVKIEGENMERHSSKAVGVERVIDLVENNKRIAELEKSLQ